MVIDPLLLYFVLPGILLCIVIWGMYNYVTKNYDSKNDVDNINRQIEIKIFEKNHLEDALTFNRITKEKFDKRMTALEREIFDLEKRKEEFIKMDKVNKPKE